MRCLKHDVLLQRTGGGAGELFEEFRRQLEEAQLRGNIHEVVRNFLLMRIPESTVLDYKWEVDLTKSSHKVKLAKWIAALANTRGGVLLLGVKEDGDTGEPDPEEPLRPVVTPPNVELVQQITNVVNGLVHPRPIYHVFPIPAGDGHAAVICVPASPNRPHVVQEGNEHVVPVRRGTSTVSASREELDQLYADRLATRTTLEQVARLQYHWYLPESLRSVPNVFIYCVPVGTPSNLITLEELREGRAYRERNVGATRYWVGHHLLDNWQWRGSPEAAAYDFSEQGKTKFRAVAYKNGAIAVWSTLVPMGWDEEDDDIIMTELYMAALYGTLAPWISFLRNFGIVAVVEGLVVLNNVAGRSPSVPLKYDPWRDFRKFRFETEPPPFSFSADTTASLDGIIDVCFKLLADMMCAAGHITDFSKRDHPYSSALERELLTR